MVFNVNGWYSVGGGHGGKPKLWSYTSDSDALQTILANDYFLSIKSHLSEDDIVFVSASDGINVINIKEINGVVTSSSIGRPQATVYVNSENDFPEASGGFITLENGKHYELGNDVTISNPIACGANNTITGGGVFSPTLTYNGTGNMFSGTDVNFGMDNIRLNCPNATVWNFSKTPSTGLGLGTINITNCIVDDCDTFAVLDDLQAFVFDNGSAINCQQGIQLSGTTNWLIFSLNKIGLISDNTGFVGVDFGSSIHRTVEVNDPLFFATAGGGTGIKGAAAGANISGDFIGTVNNGSFDVATPLDTITNGDIGWWFFSNSNIADSTAAADIYLTATRRVTTTSIGVFVEIDGTNWTTANSERFTGNNTGDLTCNMRRTQCYNVWANCTMEKVTGNSDRLALRIAKNGTTLSQSQSVTVSSDPTELTSIVQVELSTNDVLDLRIANLDSTNKQIDVTDAILMVSKA